MSSLLVWETDSKKIHCSMIEAHGTVFILENLVARLRHDWEDFYSGAEIEKNLTTNQAKIFMYIDENNLPQNKLEMPVVPDTLTPTVVDGVGLVTFSGVPVGAVITVDDEFIGEATESDVQLSFDFVGFYKVQMVLYPYLDWKEVVNATA